MLNKYILSGQYKSVYGIQYTCSKKIIFNRKILETRNCNKFSDVNTFLKLSCAMDTVQYTTIMFNLFHGFGFEFLV